MYRFMLQNIRNSMREATVLQLLRILRGLEIIQCRLLPNSPMLVSIIQVCNDNATEGLFYVRGEIKNINARIIINI